MEEEQNRESNKILEKRMRTEKPREEDVVDSSSKTVYRSSDDDYAEN